MEDPENVSYLESREEDPWAHVPPVPKTIAETGIPEAFLRELLLKALWVYDTPTTATLAEVTGLHSNVIGELINGLKREGLCEVDSRAPTTTGQFAYQTSDRGRVAAHEALERSRYVGMTPVAVSAYNQLLADQVKRYRRPPLDDVRKALEHMVLPETLVKKLGQAFFSRRALMIYGPSGNGKTEIVTSIATIVSGTVVIPYSLYAGGQLIRVFDPDVHKSLVDDEQSSDGVLAAGGARHDRRWLPVSRPTVMVGGNMGAEALEMTYDEVQGTHSAPLSVVAQGGVLIIDDLGRQKVSPKEILNRWVIMMEQGYDSFALTTSEIVRLPLDVTLVFSTNLTVNDLMDEAYLRRIAYKIPIPDISRDQMAEIARRFCMSKGIGPSETAVEHLMARLYAPGAPKPRGCYPRDIITTIIDEAEFEGREVVLSEEAIDSACSMYLGTDDEAELLAA